MLRHLFLLLAVGPLLLSCGDHIQITNRKVPPTTPEIQVVEGDTLANFGSYTRVVKLETTDDSLLGNIETVKLDPGNGDILAADLKATKGLYRFDRQGKFKSKIGGLGQGPGEYEGLVDFAVAPDGTTILLTTFKILAFNREGAFLREAHLQMTALRVTALQDRYYVYGIAPRAEQVVWIYDRKLKRRGATQQADPRLSKFLYMPREIMDANGENLFVCEPFDLALHIVDPDGTPLKHFRLPNQNHELDTVWRGFSEYDNASVQTVGMGLHRFSYVKALPNWVYLQETKLGDGLIRDNLLDLEHNRLYRFQGARLMGGSNNGPYLSLDALAGSFDKGVIGVLYQPEKIARYKDQYPLLADISFKDTDNPILLFFSFEVHRTKEGGRNE